MISIAVVPANRNRKELAMRMLQSILLATDFRPAAGAALKVAAQLAQSFGSRVTLLHVIEAVPERPEALHQLHEQAAETLQHCAAELAKLGAAVEETMIAIGSPA